MAINSISRDICVIDGNTNTVADTVGVATVQFCAIPGCPRIGGAIRAGAGALIWGDVGCSGAVNPVDSLKLLRRDAGPPFSQQSGCPPIGSNVELPSASSAATAGAETAADRASVAWRPYAALPGSDPMSIQEVIR